MWRKPMSKHHSQDQRTSGGNRCPDSTVKSRGHVAETDVQTAQSRAEDMWRKPMSRQHSQEQKTWRKPLSRQHSQEQRTYGGNRCPDSTVKSRGHVAETDVQNSQEQRTCGGNRCPHSTVKSRGHVAETDVQNSQEQRTCGGNRCPHSTVKSRGHVAETDVQTQSRAEDMWRKPMSRQHAPCTDGRAPWYIYRANDIRGRPRTYNIRILQH